MRKVKRKRDVYLWIDFEFVFEPAKQNRLQNRLNRMQIKPIFHLDSIHFPDVFCKVVLVVLTAVTVS